MGDVGTIVSVYFLTGAFLPAVAFFLSMVAAFLAETTALMVGASVVFLRIIQLNMVFLRSAKLYRTLQFLLRGQQCVYYRVAWRFVFS